MKKKQKINNKQKYLLIFIISFVLIFTYYYFNTQRSMDEMWNYGFSNNIANGLVPYRDFNMIITPLYPLIISIFIKKMPYTPVMMF